ncbi:hypothetical protein [Streptomyces sp. NPDC007905]|uniref:hypothetical protein n=1 Tax=Streptomyces sp. NPDC007905 TaxID=3364788 RepID=UPI0036EF3201
MNGESWRERRRALLREDPAAVERVARLLIELGTEERDDAEIEAEHRAVFLAATHEYRAALAVVVPDQLNEMQTMKAVRGRAGN